ncbi:MAG: phosphate ABC transporter substrate-binding protein [Intestinibacter sp.]|uniref:phosphate ABC transporter substrate-binding protein n=1 Tax=Intestinibacter sp. TaxID=1965304 RepID=UPI0025BB0CFB|nr:phosphate ABC transporter substrate-binding protein [Intestinibacter sp.]MCI6737116.1 phosphate ABC transporter substrate-binding protein [Intestinibacter sp.]
MFNKKKLISILAGTLLVGSLVGCSSGGAASSGSGASDSTKITVSGSTSIGPTMEVLAENYQKANEGVSIEVQQVGSSAGITNTIDGTSQIGMSSRDLKDEEKSEGLEEYQIAIDGIAVITNTANDVKDLTMDQIKDIYTGKITNWKEVGGKDAQIVVVSREDGSGTRDGFQEIVGFESEELTGDAQISDGSGNIKTTVQGNENAIGYISFGYLDDSINSVKIGGVEPTEENVYKDKYPISRPFLLVTKGEATGDAKALIDYILSDEGQNTIKEEGFMSINEK